MRNFLSFIRDSEKTRLDIFCYDEKEVPELSEILKKKFRFFIVRTDRDSILAFRVGEYSEVKDIMQKLEKFYGFEWDGEPLIYDTVKKKSYKNFKEGGKKLKGIYPIPKWVTDYHKKFRLKERTKCFKTCSKCGETKLISKFSIDKRNLDDRNGVCKECRNRYYKLRVYDKKSNFRNVTFQRNRGVNEEKRSKNERRKHLNVSNRK